MSELTLKIASPTREIPYPLGFNLWQQLGEFLKTNHSNQAIFAISDDQVGPLYKDPLDSALGSNPFYKGLLTFPAGEISKSNAVKGELEDRLLGNGAGRDSVLIAMGGGVVGDLVGFIAATLHRGIPLIQMPTSLLAMVDSSVGGKVGINHPVGKNLIGAFYHPTATFTDLDFLKTLPDNDFRSGMGEVIKYAVTLDENLWDLLERETEAVLDRNPKLLEKIVRRSIELKIEVVSADEKESDYRSILNWGHTVGHAIESLSKFAIPHGFAVASGMRAAARLSNQILGYPKSQTDRLDRLLSAFKLDQYRCSDFDPEAIWEIILSDKKSRQGKPRFTLMRDPGKPELFYPVEKTELFNVLQQT